MKIADYPNMEKKDRKHFHKQMTTAANPNKAKKQAEPMSLSEIEATLRAAING